VPAAILDSVFTITRKARRAAAIAIVAGVLAAPGALALATSATAAASALPRAGGAAASASGSRDYLALGDSVAFGYRPPQVTPPAAYYDAANFVGYPSVVADKLGLTVVNASCPGETTASMISTSAPSNGCENGPNSATGYRDMYPLHVAYGGSQLAFAVGFLGRNPATKLVTIDIGANDLDLCLELTPDHCAGRDFSHLLSQVGANLDTILAALRDTAGYHGEVVVLTLYSVDYRNAAAVRQIQALNAVLSRQGGLFGAQIASGFAAFKAAAAAANGDACAAGLLIKLPKGGCDPHPSNLGREVLASAVLAVVP
jgi:hypothetical protein